jgi:hypothetical protein
MVAQDSTDIDLDGFDRAILTALVAEARISIADVAPQIGLSSTACARRLKALEERGIVTGYHAALDHQRLGFAVTVLVRISLESQREEDLGLRTCGRPMRFGGALLSHVEKRRLSARRALPRHCGFRAYPQNSAGAAASRRPHSIEFCAAGCDRSKLARRAACAHIGQKAWARVGAPG